MILIEYKIGVCEVIHHRPGGCGGQQVKHEAAICLCGTMRVTKHRQRFPKAVLEPPSLETFQSYLEMVHETYPR